MGLPLCVGPPGVGHQVDEVWEHMLCRPDKDVALPVRVVVVGFVLAVLGSFGGLEAVVFVDTVASVLA